MAGLLLFALIFVVAPLCCSGFVEVTERPCLRTRLASSPSEDDLCSRYVDQVSRHYGRYTVANWRPTTPVRLGDFGTFENGQFDVRGNIEELNLRYVPEIRKGSPYKLEFTSSGVGYSKVDAGSTLSTIASLLQGNAGLEVTFKNDFGIFLTAAGCVDYRYNNLELLGDELNLIGDNYAWVTAVTKAKRMTATVSSSRGNQVVFKASAGPNKNVDVVNLEDVHLHLDIIHQELGVMNFEGDPVYDPAKEWVPLFKMHQMKRPGWLWSPTFDPITHLARIASVQAREWGILVDRLPIVEKQQQIDNEAFARVEAIGSAFGQDDQLVDQDDQPE